MEDASVRITRESRITQHKLNFLLRGQHHCNNVTIIFFKKKSYSVRLTQTQKRHKTLNLGQAVSLYFTISFGEAFYLIKPNIYKCEM